MNRMHRKGSATRIIFSGAGLLGLLLAMALYMGLFKHEAQTAVQQKKQATQQIEKIQTELDTMSEQHNAAVDEALDNTTGELVKKKTTPTPTPAVHRTATTRPAAAE